MSPILGSRKRFLYRVLIYGATPLVGLFVFLDNPDDLRGRVIGGLAVLAGALALVLLVTRLHDPWSALRYALRPVHTLRGVLAAWSREQTDGPSLIASLHAHFRQQLPDVAISTDDPTDKDILRLGEELTVIPSHNPRTNEDRDRLIERIEALRSPLESQAIMVILASDGTHAEEADLSYLDSARGIHVVRVASE